jgi:hypothetical protein
MIHKHFFTVGFNKGTEFLVKKKTFFVSSAATFFSSVTVSECLSFALSGKAIFCYCIYKYTVIKMLILYTMSVIM